MMISFSLLHTKVMKLWRKSQDCLSHNTDPDSGGRRSASHESSRSWCCYERVPFRRRKNTYAKLRRNFFLHMIAEESWRSRRLAYRHISWAAARLHGVIFRLTMGSKHSGLLGSTAITSQSSIKVLILRKFANFCWQRADKVKNDVVLLRRDFRLAQSHLPT